MTYIADKSACRRLKLFVRIVKLLEKLCKIQISAGYDNDSEVLLYYNDKNEFVELDEVSELSHVSKAKAPYVKVPQEW